MYSEKFSRQEIRRHFRRPIGPKKGQTPHPQKNTFQSGTFVHRWGFPRADPAPTCPAGRSCPAGIRLGPPHIDAVAPPDNRLLFMKYLLYISASYLWNTVRYPRIYAAPPDIRLLLVKYCAISSYLRCSAGYQPPIGKILCDIFVFTLLRRISASYYWYEVIQIFCTYRGLWHPI